MRSRVDLVLSILVVLGIQSGLWAANENVVSGMASEIHKRDWIAPARQEQLIGIAREVLSAAPSLGSDKQANAAVQLGVYLDDRIAQTRGHTDQQFAVALEIFRWQLGNYARVPDITEEDRAAARAAIGDLKQSINTVVDDVYSGASVDVKDQLKQGLGKNLDALAAYTGNYFYPEWLYHAQSSDGPGNLAEGLRASPFLNREVVAERCDQFKSWLGQVGSDNKLQKSRMAAFVGHESSLILSAAKSNVLPKVFDLGKAAAAGLYEPMPKELIEAQRRLGQELAEAGQKEFEERTQRMNREALMRDATQGSGLRVVDGVVIEDELAAVATAPSSQPVSSQSVQPMGQNAVRQTPVAVGKPGPQNEVVWNKWTGRSGILAWSVIGGLIVLMTGFLVYRKIKGRGASAGDGRAAARGPR